MTKQNFRVHWTRFFKHLTDLRMQLGARSLLNGAHWKSYEYFFPRGFSHGVKMKYLLFDLN